MAALAMALLVMVALAVPESTSRLTSALFTELQASSEEVEAEVPLTTSKLEQQEELGVAPEASTRPAALAQPIRVPVEVAVVMAAVLAPVGMAVLESFSFATD